uniref:Snake toxin/toxin-like domain-containing protein n=1 Tax=Oncorhynchus mykiss TaxID=8022 RepID=A0A8C7VL86_ONCMY
MKTILVLLMPILFGNALRCYACDETISNALCNQNIENCYVSNDTCMTAVTQICKMGIQYIYKTCTNSLTCRTAASTNTIPGALWGIQVSCCQTDLCNVNGSSVSGLNFMLLSLSFLLSGLVLSL